MPKSSITVKKNIAERIGHIDSEKFLTQVKELGSLINITRWQHCLKKKGWEHGQKQKRWEHSSWVCEPDNLCEVWHGGGTWTGQREVDSAFGDIVELSDGTDSKLVSKRSLWWVVLNEFLRKNLICVAKDGAAVLSARAGRLLTKVKQDLPKVQSI